MEVEFKYEFLHTIYIQLAIYKFSFYLYIQLQATNKSSQIAHNAMPKI